MGGYPLNITCWACIAVGCGVIEGENACTGYYTAKPPIATGANRYSAGAGNGCSWVPLGPINTYVAANVVLAKAHAN